MPSLPRIGVEAVVDNMAGFNSAISQVESRIDRASSAIQKSAAGTGAFDKSLGSVERSLKDVGSAGESAAGGLAGLAEGFSAIAVAAIAGAAAIALAAVAFTGFLALGQRGEAMGGIIQSFAILEGKIGDSTAALQRMRDASRGTISDIELMKSANLGLIGAQGEFAKQLSDAIPKAMEVARLTAIATGQSFDVVYEKLIRGLKRLEPRLIDDTGIVIRRADAYEHYAAKINKSTDALTAQEKQIAVLQEFMLLAQPVLDEFGNLHETAAIKADRLNTTLTNMGDALAQVVQPAYAALIDGLQGVLNFFSSLLEQAMPYLDALSQMFADVFDGIFGSISNALGALNAGELVKGFFTGGAKIIGALAGGMAAAARATVIPVIKAIAKAIADFLSGFSPPPEGPLSTIDVGGANVMKAWLEGFLGVSLDPIAKVAGQVSDIMGTIGTASREFVEARLKALDDALAPFQNRLALVKAQFDALKEPVDAAFNSIDRQMERALVALNKGEQGSGAMVRQLDKQRTALEDYVDAQQAQVDQAQIQLSLAEAQQAVERTSLEIRQKQLGPAEKIAKAAEPKAKKPKKGGGGGGGKAEDLSGGGGGGAPTGLTAASAAAAARAAAAGQDIADSFNEGFTGAGGDVAGLQADIADIQGSTSSIGDSLSRIGKKIQDAFQGAFDPTKLGEGFLGAIQGFVDFILDKMKEFIITGGPAKLLAGFTSAITGLANTIAGVVDPIAAGIMNGIRDWISNNGPQKLIDGITSLVSNVATHAKDLVDAIAREMVEGIRAWFADHGPEKLYQGIHDALYKLVSRATELVVELAGAIVKGIADFISGKGDLSDGIHKALKAVGDWLSGDGLTTLLELGAKLVVGILAGIAGLITGIAQAIVDGVTKGINDIAAGKAKPSSTTVSSTSPIGTPLNLPGRAADVGGGLPGGGGKAGTQAGDVMGRQAEALNEAQAGQGPDDSLGAQIGRQIADDIVKTVAQVISEGTSTITEALVTALGDSIMVAQEVAVNAITTLVSVVQDFLTSGFSDAFQFTFDTVNATITTTHRLALQTAFANAITNGPIAWLLGTGVSVFLDAMNTIITSIADWTNTVAAPVLTGVGEAIATFISAPFSAITAAIKHAVGLGLRAILAAVKGSGLLLFIPQLSNLIGAFENALTTLGAARGGLFSGGLLKVGERGPELVGSAEKLAVFPASVTKMLESLNSIMAQPRYVPAQAASYQYNNQRSMGDVNFYGIQGTNDAMHRYAMLRAMGRTR